MTVQIPELIILNGEKKPILYMPPLLPETHPQILDAGTENLSAIHGSTACWRRYEGTWEIKQDKLYLVELIGQYKLVDGIPVFADWFSGELVVPQGNILKNECCSSLDVYEKELHFIIEKGVVLETVTIDNRDKKKKKRGKKRDPEN
jgi:hypothetical protein